MRLCCCGCAARADEERHRKVIKRTLISVRNVEVSLLMDVCVAVCRLWGVC